MKLAFDWRGALRYFEILGLVITLVLLPLDRFPYLHYIPFSLGLVSLIFLVLATAGRLLDLLLHKDYARLKRHFFVGVLIALPVAAYGVSVTYAIDGGYALSATKLLLAVGLRAFCFYVILSESPRLWPLVKKTIYITTAAVVAFGIFQYVLDTFGAPPFVTDLKRCCTSNDTYVFPRVHSTALEPLYLDHFLMIPLWLLAFDFWKDKKSRKNKWLLTLFLATATLFILTIARSATISLLIAALIFYLGAKRTAGFQDFFRFMLKRIGIALLISIAMVAISGVASIFITKSSIYGSNSGIGSVGLFGKHAVSIDDGSAKTRYDLWPKSIGYIKEQPLRGVGAYNSRIRLNMDKYNAGAPVASLQPFNNDLLGLLVDLGLLGIVTFGPLLVSLVLIVIWLYKKEWGRAQGPYALALIGMLLQSNFFHSILLTRLWVVVGITLTFLFAQPPVRNNKKVSAKSSV